MDDNLYLRAIDCPVCSNPFKSTKTKSSKLRFVKSDTDMCRYFEGGNPYLYEINVCPSCGFSFSDNFKQDIDYTRKSEFIKTVSSHWKKQNFCGERTIDEAIETYKLALLSGRFIGLSEGNTAGICMRICWLNRMAGNLVEEKRFMKAAGELYHKVYEMGGFRGGQDISPEILVYLLGELNYRLGDHNECMKWFNIAISKYSRDPFIKKQTVDMILERWMDIKEDIKKKQA